jgi:hypothetical protein
MRFLRPVAGFNILDQKINTDIRTELSNYDVSGKIERLKKN